MQTLITCEYSESSLNSSTVSFQQQNIHQKNEIDSLSTIPYQSQNNNQNQITIKGESIIDLGYFQFFKQTYKPKTHPINNFFNVISSKKSKNFVELSIQKSSKNFNMSNLAICENLQEVCPSKVEKARKLYDIFINDINQGMYTQQPACIESISESEQIQQEVFQSAASCLNQRANKLFKFNIYYKNEDNQFTFLKHGISMNALNVLKMSPDFYQYVHMRFGMSPFVDRFYSKNFFEINYRLLDQSLYQNNNQYQTKYAMNLSSVGAIYEQTECEIIDLGNGFFLEIQYYPNESVLSNQVPEINKRLRVQAREFVYSSASSSFINKYYPNVKTWQQSQRQEVDSDLVEKIIKKRELNQQIGSQQHLFSHGSQDSASKNSFVQGNTFIY